MKEKKFLLTIHEKNLEESFEAESKEEAIDLFIEKFIEQIEPDDVIEVKERKFGGGVRDHLTAKSFPNFSKIVQLHAEAEEERRLASEREKELESERLEEERKQEKERKLAQRREKDRKRRMERQKKKEEQEKNLQDLVELETLLDSNNDKVYGSIDLYIENAFLVVDAKFSSPGNSKKEIDIRKRIFYKSLSNTSIRAAIEIHQAERGRRSFIAVMQHFENLSKEVEELQQKVGGGNKTRSAAALAGALFATQGIEAIRDEGEGEGGGDIDI